MTASSDWEGKNEVGGTRLRGRFLAAHLAIIVNKQRVLTHHSLFIILSRYEKVVFLASLSAPSWIIVWALGFHRRRNPAKFVPFGSIRQSAEFTNNVTNFLLLSRKPSNLLQHDNHLRSRLSFGRDLQRYGMS